MNIDPKTGFIKGKYDAMINEVCPHEPGTSEYELLLEEVSLSRNIRRLEKGESIIEDNDDVDITTLTDRDGSIDSVEDPQENNKRRLSIKLKLGSSNKKIKVSYFNHISLIYSSFRRISLLNSWKINLKNRFMFQCQM